ncbi:DNA polymerase III delta prime subunit [hydrothermal vent metagenome]|uniref:DNA polymerase III delta prime subunit n=1 Tax=hydrothermal vent metagenome TaxID=652676 RepID=A0A1W1EL96_9ZZZZ
MKLNNQIIITNNINAIIEKLESLVVDEEIIKIVNEKSFLVEDTKEAIRKAYITSSNKTIIILASKSFSEVVQNRLLKVIEEPPPNKEFIIIASSKSSILPTIKSRLPLYTLNSKIEEEPFELNLSKLNLKDSYEFIKLHQRTNSYDAKKILERLLKEAINSRAYNLDKSILKLFENGYKALDVGSPTPFVLTTLILKLLAKKI